MTQYRDRYPQHDAEIVRLYAEGRSLREIAAHIGWSQGFVRARLVRHGVPLRPRGGNGRTAIREDDDRIIELWNAGYSAIDIARRTNWSATFVRRRLYENDINPSESPKRYPDRIPEEEIARVVFMYDTMKMDMWEIARHFGWKSTQPVKNRLDRGGIPRRSKQEVSKMVHAKAKKDRQPVS